MRAIRAMSNETQPLAFKDIKQGPPECYISYRELTPTALEQLQERLGKPVEVTSINEKWFYEGEDEGDDHSTSQTHVRGTLTKVSGRTVEVEIQSGETTYDSGAVIEVKETHKEFPFYLEQFGLRTSTEISHISTLTVADQTYQLLQDAGADGHSVSEAANEKVMYSVREISDIISSYNKVHSRLNITRVTAALRFLRLEEFPLLYEKLAALANSPIAEVRFDPLAEIMLAAESDRQFGEMSEGMAEFYANEARAVSQDQLPQERVLDSVVKHVKAVEAKKKEQALKPTTPFVVLYDNGDDMQASHGKKIDVPAGEDPREFAHDYLLTITSPGENGLLVEEIEELKPGEKFKDF